MIPDMRSFWDALDDAVKETGRSLRSICEGAKVPYDRVKQARGRNSKVDVTDAVLIANELGYTLDDFVKADRIEDRSEIARIYNSLSPRERRMLKAGAAAEDEGEAEPPRPAA